MGERHVTSLCRAPMSPPVSLHLLARLPSGPSYFAHRCLLGRETPHGDPMTGWFCLRGIPLLTFFPHPTRVSRGCGSVGRASPCQGEGRGFESRHPLGRLAQRERASLTRKRSLVRSQYRPPELNVRPSPERPLRAYFVSRATGVVVGLPWWCASPGSRVPAVPSGRHLPGFRPDSGRIRDAAPQWPGPTAYLDHDLAATAGNGVSQRALPSGEELVPAARNGWS